MKIPFHWWLCAGVIAMPGPVISQDEEISLKEAQIQFADADEAMNAAYLKAREQLPPGHFALLREEQREWIPYRDARADVIVEGSGAEPDSDEALIQFWESKYYDTKTRTRMILGWLGTSAAGTWEGEWEDGFGGYLVIQDHRDGTISFNVQAVRGRSHHSGFLSGKAKVTGTTAGFKIRAEGFDEDTTLNFALRPEGVRLAIEGEFTSPFHGASAYFDGIYTRVGPLTDELRAEMNESGY